MHRMKMGREGIVSPVLWTSGFWSEQQTQRFVKDIKLLSAGLQVNRVVVRRTPLLWLHNPLQLPLVQPLRIKS